MTRPGEHADRARRRAAAALDAERESIHGDPVCAECGSVADFFLFEPERVARFVCWEHVSPISAVVDPDGTVDRPIAVPLTEEFR
ncbi:MAG: hypothetical protein ABEJ55_03485 [Halanaeroarchaeum sp.]